VFDVKLTARFTTQRVSAAIYGLIVTGAVLAGAQSKESGREVVVEVLAVIMVYWLTEQYAEYMGLRLTAGLPGRTELLADLRGSLTMVQVTLVPLVVLVVAEPAQASIKAAVVSALIATVATLAVLVAVVSRVSRMSMTVSLLSGGVAAVVGATLVAFKASVMH
jgi:hypothetical protein